MTIVLLATSLFWGMCCLNGMFRWTTSRRPSPGHRTRSLSPARATLPLGRGPSGSHRRLLCHLLGQLRRFFVLSCLFGGQRLGAFEPPRLALELFDASQRANIFFRLPLLLPGIEFLGHGPSLARDRRAHGVKRCYTICMPVDIDIYRHDVVAGIDPGAACGVAIFNRGQLLRCDSVKGNEQTALAVINSLGGPAAIVIERQFQRKGDKFNPRAVETLMRRRIEWEVAAKIRNCPVVLAYPTQWQSVLPKIRTMNTKQRARLYCQGAGYPMAQWTDDQCDAAVIGAWYIQRVKWARMVS